MIHGFQSALDLLKSILELTKSCQDYFSDIKKARKKFAHWDGELIAIDEMCRNMRSMILLRMNIVFSLNEYIVEKDAEKRDAIWESMHENSNGRELFVLMEAFENFLYRIEIKGETLIKLKNLNEQQNEVIRIFYSDIDAVRQMKDQNLLMFSKLIEELYTELASLMDTDIDELRKEHIQRLEIFEKRYGRKPY